MHTAVDVSKVRGGGEKEWACFFHGHFYQLCKKVFKDFTSDFGPGRTIIIIELRTLLQYNICFLGLLEHRVDRVLQHPVTCVYALRVLLMTFGKKRMMKDIFLFSYWQKIQVFLLLKLSRFVIVA